MSRPKNSTITLTIDLQDLAAKSGVPLNPTRFLVAAAKQTLTAKLVALCTPENCLEWVEAAHKAEIKEIKSKLEPGNPAK